MILEGKNILLISPEPWSEVWVSKHHYAHHLAKMSNKVFFLNPPSKITEVNEVEPNLWVIHCKPKYRGLHFLPHRINAFLTKVEFQYVQKLSEIKFDMIWNFDSSRFFNLSKIDTVNICHIVDWNQNFQREILAATSNLCLSTSSYLQEELARFNPKSYFVQHGFTPNKIVPIELPGNSNQIKAAYVGNLNIKYLDWPLIHKLVSSKPDVDFYFIGPYNLDEGHELMKSVFDLDNSFFIGPVPSYMIGSYLDLMNILLLVYLANKYPIQLSNPHKILEYLGSGKTILATHTSQYDQHLKLLFMTSQEQYIENFNKIISKLTIHNSIYLKEKRIDFAIQNSYSNQIKKIAKFINE
ncbi:MAG: hypothetical protein JXR07_20105 [Reichenbachiella sp.]